MTGDTLLNIRLSEENSRVGSNYSQADGELYYFLHLPTHNTKEEAEVFLQQILNYQAIVKKLDESIKNVQEIQDSKLRPTWKTLLIELEAIRTTKHSEGLRGKQDE